VFEGLSNSHAGCFGLTDDHGAARGTGGRSSPLLLLPSDFPRVFLRGYVSHSRTVCHSDKVQTWKPRISRSKTRGFADRQPGVEAGVLRGIGAGAPPFADGLVRSPEVSPIGRSARGRVWENSSGRRQNCAGQQSLVLRIARRRAAKRRLAVRFAPS
jgi:hypothetical protein